MQFAKNKTISAAALVAALTLGGGSAANAGVAGCSAPGGKQEAGVVIGAVLGGLFGNAIGGRDADAETIGGAAIGAAVGSAIGCKIQKTPVAYHSTRQVREHHGVSPVVTPVRHARIRYRLAPRVQPARYCLINRPFVAEHKVKLRAAPTKRSRRVGRLWSGERFQALGQVRGTDWILVGKRGVGIGYVLDDRVRSLGSRYAYGFDDPRYKDDRRSVDQTG